MMIFRLMIYYSCCPAVRYTRYTRYIYFFENFWDIIYIIYYNIYIYIIIYNIIYFSYHYLKYENTKCSACSACSVTFGQLLTIVLAQSAQHVENAFQNHINHGKDNSSKYRDNGFKCKRWGLHLYYGYAEGQRWRFLCDRLAPQS